MHTLIIVDDDELIRRGLEKVVPWGNLGFSVSSIFPSATDALSWLKDNQVDVILTDIKMPRMSGLDLIGEARRLWPRTKAVVISGFNEFDLVKSALTLKVEDYLLKPLSIKDVEKVFRKIAEDLDGEKALMEKPGLLETCFSLQRTLVSEFRIWEEYVSDRKTRSRLCLVSYSGGLDKEIKQILDGLHHALSSDAFTFIAEVEEVDGKVNGLKSLFVERGVSYRIVVGGEVFWIDDIMSSFWKAYDTLSASPENSVTNRSGSGSLKPRSIVEKGRSELISSIEDTSDNTLVGKIDEIIASSRELDNAEVRYVYYAIIGKLSRHFSLTEDVQLYPSDMDRATMDESFMRDVIGVKERIAENKSSNAQLIARKANKTIRESYWDSSLSLSSVASSIGVSYGYLSSVFSEIIGESFKSYLIKVRMEEARKLLLSRRYRVFEIADKVGYRSTKYFTEAFHNYFGLSPAEFVKEGRK